MPVIIRRLVLLLAALACAAASGEQSALDRCCSGAIRKTGARPSRTRYVVTASVSGWRAYWVHAATLRYKYRARI